MSSYHWWVDFDWAIPWMWCNKSFWFKKRKKKEMKIKLIHDWIFNRMIFFFNITWLSRYSRSRMSVICDGSHRREHPRLVISSGFQNSSRSFLLALHHLFSFIFVLFHFSLHLDYFSYDVHRSDVCQPCWFGRENFFIFSACCIFEDLFYFAFEFFSRFSQIDIWTGVGYYLARPPG